MLASLSFTASSFGLAKLTCVQAGRQAVVVRVDDNNTYVPNTRCLGHTKKKGDRLLLWTILSELVMASVGRTYVRTGRKTKESNGTTRRNYPRHNLIY